MNHGSNIPNTRSRFSFFSWLQNKCCHWETCLGAVRRQCGGIVGGGGGGGIVVLHQQTLHSVSQRRKNQPDIVKAIRVRNTNNPRGNQDAKSENAMLQSIHANISSKPQILQQPPPTSTRPPTHPTEKGHTSPSKSSSSRNRSVSVRASASAAACAGVTSLSFTNTAASRAASEAATSATVCGEKIRGGTENGVESNEIKVI